METTKGIQRLSGSPMKEQHRRIESLVTLHKKLEQLRDELDQLEKEAAADQIGLDIETGVVNPDKLITATASPSDLEEIEMEFPNTPVEKIVKEEVVEEMNDKTVPQAEEKLKRRGLKKVAQRVKVKLLAILIAATNIGANTSFTPYESRESRTKARTYNELKVNNLKAWEEAKLNQDEVNKLGNILVINEAHKGSDKKYIIIDKNAGLAHLYQGDSLISTYEVGVGKNSGDAQTKTVIRDGKVYWEEGNKQTGAGIYTLNTRGTFEGFPSFTMLNERGIEVPTVLHHTIPSRNQYFKNNNQEDNRMSNGCLNFQADSWNNLVQQKGFGEGSKVYILPDDPHNKFILIDGELRFESADEEVNRTIRPFEAQPILMKKENASAVEVEFLETITESKAKLMSLYPTVSNDVYNQLAKIAYGIFGQESSFGTYGGARGQLGRISDYIGSSRFVNRNVSAGVAQIRITSVDKKVQDMFDIKSTADLFDTKKNAVACMALLLHIYVNNIPKDEKENYLDAIIYYYNNPTGSQKMMQENTKSDSVYVKNVRAYSEGVKVYLLQGALTN